ncbi:hypothetical protein B0H11DRAFT_1928898 [Mycena galericulata]|nr:hypothetical protein B0H11DRAFT_1928898 [Mycena galericulata]
MFFEVDFEKILSFYFIRIASSGTFKGCTTSTTDKFGPHIEVVSEKDNTSKNQVQRSINLYDQFGYHLTTATKLTESVPSYHRNQINSMQISQLSGYCTFENRDDNNTHPRKFGVLVLMGNKDERLRLARLPTHPCQDAVQFKLAFEESQETVFLQSTPNSSGSTVTQKNGWNRARVSFTSSFTILFRLNRDTEEWMEQGKGIVHLLVHNTTGTIANHFCDFERGPKDL